MQEHEHGVLKVVYTINEQIIWVSLSNRIVLSIFKKNIKLFFKTIFAFIFIKKKNLARRDSRPVV